MLLLHPIPRVHGYYCPNGVEQYINSGPVGQTCSNGSLRGTLLKELSETNQMGLKFFVALLVHELSFFCIFTKHKPVFVLLLCPTLL